MIHYFDPPPPPSDVPAQMPSPFAVPPHPLALRAIRELEPFAKDQREGKMFGVLVVRDAGGRIGYLRAFSGMLDGSWDRAGFVGPVFDVATRDAFWPAGEAELGVLAGEQRVLDDDPVHAEHAVLVARHAGELVALKARHAERKAGRALARQSGGSHAPPSGRPSPAGTGASLLRGGHAGDRFGLGLDQESRADSAERRELDRVHARELGPLAARAAELTTRAKQLARRRGERSRDLLVQIQDTYAFANARGETRTLRELFAPDSPPGGAGDCAAPKLLAYAYRHGLQPIALAEVWLGPPPSAGDRRSGTCYPACRGKCGPILAHVLQGLDAAPAPVFGDATAISADEPRVVFEDRWLVVVAKPVGLLSVPGRSGLLTDSVQTRLAARYGAAFIVHRLDLDVSGLMLVAKDAATHAILQKAFARREIHKRYIAILEAAPAPALGDAGTISLALRVDLDDRPRQLVDPIHGKVAITDWQRVDGARVALVPRTGRTHQLRVHSAHPAGLASPIAGDRLYGTPGPRLLLHAEHLAFAHPHSGERIALELPAPF